MSDQILPLGDLLNMSPEEFKSYTDSLSGIDTLESNDLVTKSDSLSDVTTTTTTSTIIDTQVTDTVSTTTLTNIINDQDDHDDSEDTDEVTTTTSDTRVVISSSKLIKLLDLVNSISTNSSPIEKKLRFYRVLSRATTTPLDVAMSQLGATDSLLSDVFTLGYKEPYLIINPGSIWKLTARTTSNTSLDTTYVDQNSVTPSVHSNDYSLVTETYYYVYDIDTVNDQHEVKGINLITANELLVMRSNLKKGESVELVHDARPEKVTIDNTGKF